VSLWYLSFITSICPAISLMSWREFVVLKIGHGGFSGITLPLWLRILWENRLAIDPPYWVRGCAVTACSVQNSLFAILEEWLYGRRIRQTEVKSPLFILGSWRSGTTHLHNLLAQDERFAWPNLFEVFYPRTFLLTGWINRPLLAAMVPPTRPQDNVVLSLAVPQEDEFAIANLCGCSFALAWAFSRNRNYYDRFMTLRGASPDEVRRWQDALLYFAQKLTLKFGKRLVLKSPAHTGRIKRLLEVFPDANFIHIRRHPHDVYRSTVYTIRKVYPWWSLQRPDYPRLEEDSIAQYRELYEAFFEEVPLIPVGHFHDLAYEDLERDPIGTVRQAYEALSLPDFSAFEPKLNSYLAQIKAYRKNEFPPLAEEVRQRLASEWKRPFEAWGYEP